MSKVIKQNFPFIAPSSSHSMLKNCAEILKTQYLTPRFSMEKQ